MLCARTSAGEAELATPSQGLTLGQRRVLTLLQSPAAVEELAEKNHLEPEKLARDLTRLADLRLVLLQGSTVEAPAPAAPLEVPAMASVVIGRTSRRTLPLAAGAVVLLLAAGIWYGMRAKDPAPADPPEPVVQTAPVPAPAGSAPAMVATSAIDAKAATAIVLRGNAAPLEIRPEIRPGLVVPTPAKPATTPAAPEPKVALAPVVGSGNPAPAPIAAPGAALTGTPPVATQSPAPATADAPPPLQLAAAAPAAPVPRPTVAAELRAISREAPDFPKEAVADGYKSGIVNARIHVDSRGNVASVDILGSQPAKVFDRAARKALLRWQFEPLAAGQTGDLDVDVKFQRE